MRVSVIVAAYNTGAGLRELIASLDAQSMSRDEFEVVVVDDGSTDDTAEIAHELARSRPNLVVETIPNSGWPGRPRNVGTDLARGDYVFFCDHDDAFGPRALEVMYDSAVTNGSDIVYGKVVRKGRSTPYWSLWRSDDAHADVTGPAISSRTVHKLYRRAFLVEHGIRFREGRIRLEDHEFMAQALPRAKNISVVASVPCYWWIHRPDGSNTSNTPVAADVYWGHYAHALRTLEECAGPGPLLDAGRLISVIQAFSRFGATAYLARTPDKRRELFEAVHPVIRDHLPTHLDARLPALKRVRVQALRAGDMARFDRLQEFRRGISFVLSTEDVSVHDGRLHVALTARCVSGLLRPLVPEVVDGRMLLPLPRREEASADDRALIPEDRGTLEVTIRHRSRGVEWPVPTQRSTLADDGGLRVRTEAQIDLASDAFGGTLDLGVWDLLARIQFLGDSTIRRIAVPVGGVPAQQPTGTAVYATADGKVSFKVKGNRARPLAAEVTWEGRRLRVRLAGEAAASEILVGIRGDKSPTQAAAVVDGSALVNVTAVPGGDILDFWAREPSGTMKRLAYEGAELKTRRIGRQYRAYSTQHLSLSVKR